MTDSNDQLLTAAQDGDIAGVHAHLMSGFNPNGKGTTRLRPLHSASKAGHLEMVHLLLVNGADPNVKDSSGATPLHYAAQHGYDEILQVLLDKLADPNITNNSGLTPLHYAVLGAKFVATRLLLDRGADPKAEDNAGLTPLHSAKCDNIARLLRGETVAVPDQERNVSPIYPISMKGITLNPWPALAADASDTNYVLIQSRGGLTPLQETDTKNAGLDIIDYVSRNTYLCRYLATDLDKIRRMWPIIFADVYRVEFKLSGMLWQADHDLDYEVDIIYHTGVSDSPSLRERILGSSGVNVSVDTFGHGKARLTTQAQYLRAIALIDEVRYIELVGRAVPQRAIPYDTGSR